MKHVTQIAFLSAVIAAAGAFNPTPGHTAQCSGGYSFSSLIYGFGYDSWGQIIDAQSTASAMCYRNITYAFVEAEKQCKRKCSFANPNRTDCESTVRNTATPCIDAAPVFCTNSTFQFISCTYTSQGNSTCSCGR